jgi:hypothetical protein
MHVYHDGVTRDINLQNKAEYAGLPFVERPDAASPANRQIQADARYSSVNLAGRCSRNSTVSGFPRSEVKKDKLRRCESRRERTVRLTRIAVWRRCSSRFAPDRGPASGFRSAPARHGY